MPDIFPDTKSIYYKKYIADWIKIGTILEGESAIKAAGPLYLPKLTGQNPTEYKAYKDRGTFFNAFDRTVTGFSGAIVRKEPNFETSSKVKKILPHITINNESIQEVTEIISKNLLSYGYFGILVDMPVVEKNAISESPYFALYGCETIYNFEIVKQGSKNKLMWITLGETAYVPDPKNKYSMIKKDRVRELAIEDDFLVVRVFEEKRVSSNKYIWEQVGEDVYPKIRGKRMMEIPFVFFGAVTNSPIPQKPTLETLANLNIKHWQVTVDYYHGLHYCAIPTPWAAGFPKTAELFVGGQKAWISEDPTASCGFLEFTGQGLQSVENAMDRLENQMAVAGAKILEARKNGVEAADTTRMHFSGDSANLSSIVTSVETGLQKAFGFMDMMFGDISPRNNIVKLNREFVSDKLTAQDIQALLQAWQGGGISLDTFLMNLKNGEVLSQDQSIEDEKTKIEEETSNNPKFTNNDFGGMM